MHQSDPQEKAIIEKISQSKKYRQSGLNNDTIQDLIQQESLSDMTEKSLLKSVRRKLHNIVAPYLGELDYQTALDQLQNLTDFSIEGSHLREFCQAILASHASSAERLPYLSTFYEQLFKITGQPSSILDLACGLHPFGFPWMGLPLTTRYDAYDIIQPRIDLIRKFFKQIGLSAAAENRDVLVNPPKKHADLGLFFKEAHRFEKRRPGCNRLFWQQLNVDVLAVSLPAVDLTGSHSLLDRHRQLVRSNLSEQQSVQEILIGDEIIFLITRKTGKK